MASHKPDLSHLQVWGCKCYVAIPDEVCGKVGPKRFQAIFVGYEEHRVGWHVRSPDGQYSFSNNVVFNETLPGCLGVSHSLSPASHADSLPISSQSLHERIHLHTSAGRDYDEVLHLKALQKIEQDKKCPAPFISVNGGVNGGADVPLAALVNSCFHYGLVDLSPSMDSLAYLSSFVSSPSSDDTCDLMSLNCMESDII